MIRFSNIYLPSRLFVIAALDGIFLTAAFFFSFQGIPASKSLTASCVVAVLFLACFYLFDLYDLDATRKVRDVLLKGLRAIGTGLLLLIPIGAASFFFRPSYRLLESNLIVVLLLICIYRGVSEWLHVRAWPAEKILLVGSDPSIELLVDALRQRFCLPLRLSAIVPELGIDRSGKQHFAMCSDVTKISEVMNTFRAQRIVLSMQIESPSVLASELLSWRSQGTRIEDANALYMTLTGRVPVAQLDIRGLIFGKGLAVSRLSSAMRRLFDCAFALVALFFCAPLFLVIALCIKLDSRGPIFYKQERVGLNGKTFLVFKFRSMGQFAEAQSGPVWASTTDTRVTRVGRVLRKLRLDELPQFLNVLRGDMFLIGPRPERPHFVEMLCREVPFYNLRHSVRPGITGWAQVSIGYGATTEESQEKLEYDLFYIINRTFLLDFLILIKTVKIICLGKGAR
jgi:exopolysaccharide biosynthesis polyprenyl glycosylphosphotransferase